MISIYELPIKRTTIPVTMNFQQLGKKQLHRHKQLEIIFMLNNITQKNPTSLFMGFFDNFFFSNIC